MEYQSWYQCVRGCDTRYSIFDVVYHCEKCGGLLEVVHDMDALKQHSADEWKELFTRRARTPDWLYGGGVWGKKEWVCPQIDRENIVSMYEGHSNCFHATRLGETIGVPDLWVKLCGNSHTGSFKDLGMTVLVSVVKQMISQGKPIKAIACASTGDTSAALAAYAAAAGIPAVILLPKDKVSPEQLIQPIANGAAVFALDTDFDGCMELVKELIQDPAIYLANSMNSLRIEGQKTVAIEVVQGFNWQVPDWFVLPVGNLGNVSALGKGLLLMKELGMIDRLPRILCAQAEKANPFYRSFQTGFRQFVPVAAQKTLASAIQIGNPVSYERAVKVMQQFNGIVEQVSEEELAEASARADRTGLYTCPHTGVALGALIKAATRGEIKKNERVVVISTAHGLKFSSMKVAYHTGQLKDVSSRLANTALELPPDVEQVRRAISALQ